ncbi:uncharacterized protein LOC128894257 isoform X1 [Hylaeus anthracinus]|uniref:uncharacterized protein LOC128894257 isoform X1 n=1 Tax=Hylaeus anthracinus TaxID=313031 RepID=UPI0023B9B2AB|nr:uncharacterized protein LOC128894257 isoform X1 [Hylaeus anthracinus]
MSKSSCWARGNWEHLLPAFVCMFRDNRNWVEKLRVRSGRSIFLSDLEAIICCDTFSILKAIFTEIFCLFNKHESIFATMSGKLQENNMQWDSSTDEDTTYECRYNMRLRDSLKNNQQSIISQNETISEPRKRGRGCSKRPCLNKNALMARENRQKKKAYLEKVESMLSFYQKENKNLTDVIRKQSIDIKRLTGEVAYLRNVLKNNTNISLLLKTINNGLRKINTLQKNSFHPHHVSQCSNESETQCKCTCYTDSKEKVLHPQNSNIFINNDNNDILTKHSISESQSSKSYVNNKNQIICKNHNIDKIFPLSLDSDHTYAISETSIADVKNSLNDKETINTITSTTDLFSGDTYVNDENEFDCLLPVTQGDLSNVDEKKDNDPIGIDFDQLSSFNMDIFEDLPKCDEMMDSVESLNDTSNLFTEEETSHSPDNTGICLHVNSDKVSLEFCSICHLNSKNSRLN